MRDARKAQDGAQRDYEEAQRKLEVHNQRAQDLSHKVDLAAQRQKNEADNLEALAAEAIEQRQKRKAKAVANTQQELKRLRDELAAQDRRREGERVGAADRAGRGGVTFV